MKKYQVKIMIKNSKPPIWRRCIIPAGISFSKLSEILDTVMGWEENQDNEFEFYHRKQYISDYDRNGRKGETISACDTIIDSYMEQEEWFTYTYKLDEQVQHRVTIEDIVEDDEEGAYVIKFKGNCPVKDGEEKEYDMAVVNQALKDSFILTQEEEKVEEQLHQVMEQLFSQMEEEEEKEKEVNRSYENDFIYQNRMNTRMMAQNLQHSVMKEKKIYPNDLCPCGSGKKYKYCCK